MKESEQNIGPSMMDTFVTVDAGLFLDPIKTKMVHNHNIGGKIKYCLWFIIKDIINPYNCWKMKFFNQNNQWLNNILYHQIANLLVFWMA